MTSEQTPPVIIYIFKGDPHPCREPYYHTLDHSKEFMVRHLTGGKSHLFFPSELVRMQDLALFHGWELVIADRPA